MRVPYDIRLLQSNVQTELVLKYVRKYRTQKDTRKLNAIFVRKYGSPMGL